MPELTERQVAAELEAFLRRQFPATALGLRHDIDLYDSGVIDSVGIAETLAHIEQRYRLTITDETLLSPEFTTIAGIARTIVAISRLTRQPR